MQRISSDRARQLRRYFQIAAKAAKHSTCHRAHCGAVIVKDTVVIGSGWNSPPLEDEMERTCGASWDYSLKPKYDKTCCVHAEWRAILEALKQHGAESEGSTLYFMRIDEHGNFTDAGRPFCTVCSRLAREAGINYFALWNDQGVDLYTTHEYDLASYAFYKV